MPHRLQLNEASRARLVLAGWLAFALYCVGVTLSPLASGFADAPYRGPGDVALYNAEVARIRAGQGYYEAAAAELRPRGYPTRSLFNWRTPLPMWLVGQLPQPAIAQWMLGGICLAVVVLGFTLMAREGSTRQAMGCVVLLSGAVLPCLLGNLFVMPELWAGMLIALSLCLYGLDRPYLGAIGGLGALLFRELAAPYCLLSLGLALWNRRWREVGLWTAGLAGYTAFYSMHASMVSGLIDAGDAAHEHGWVRFGGTAFVLSTSQVNAYLLLLPQWLTAIYFALAMLGFAAWRGPVGLRFGLTAAAYVVGFGVVGQDFNQYWGSMTTPLFCFGVARSGAVVAALTRRAASSPGPLWAGAAE